MDSNMMADGVISLDDTPAQEAVKRANTSLDGYEKKSKTVLDRAGKEWAVYGDGVVRVSERSKSSLDKLLTSMQRQSELAGKSGAQRLVAERDQLIQRWGQEKTAVDAITQSYQKRIAAELALQNASAATSAATISEQRAATIAMKGIEGGLMNSNRAAAAFLVSINGIGPVLQAAFPIFGALAFIGVMDEAITKVVEFERAWDPVYQAEKRALEQGKTLLKDFEETNKKTQDAIREQAGYRFGSGKDREKGLLGYDIQDLSLTVSSDDQTRIRQVQSQMDAANKRFQGGRYFDDRTGFEKLTKDAQAAEVELGSLRKEMENAVSKLNLDQLTLQNKKFQLADINKDEAKSAAKELADALRERRRELASINTNPFSALEAQRSDAVSDAVEKFGKQKAGPLTDVIGQLFDSKTLKLFNDESERTSKELDALTEHWRHLEIESRKVSGDVFKSDIEEGTKLLEEQGKAVGRLAAEWVKLQSSGESQSLAHQKRMIGITGDPNNPLGTLARQQGLDYSAIERRRQDELNNLSSNPLQALLQRSNAEKEAANAVGELRYQWEEKVAELRADEVRKEVDSIKNQLEPLFRDLFDNPRNFGKQLAKTVRDAAINPIVSGMASTSANILAPLFGGGGGFFGRGGNGANAIPWGGGGFSAVSGPGAVGPVVGGNGGNAMPWSGGGAVAPAISVGGGGFGFGGGGFSAPAVPMGGLSPWSGDSFGFPGAPGGTSGFAGPVGGGASAGAPMGGGHPANSAGFGALAGVFRGGLGGLRSGLGGFTRSPMTADYDPDTNSVSSSGGRITGVNGLAGAALGAGGMALAQNGLMGDNRGTWGGVAEGTIGGAAVGLQAGGPLGAAVGAAVGFSIGVSEMLAGVESPLNKTKRLVKDIYRIGISTNEARQILSLAQQKYGTNIDVTVRSPEVRQLLGLYAAASGQASKFPSSADTPHGASLVESAGRLYQGNTYQYGNPYTYASNLPVYGGNPGGQLNNPGQINISMSVGPQSLDRFWNGQVFTPDAVSSQVAAAYAGSNGRTAMSADLNSPGELVS